MFQIYHHFYVISPRVAHTKMDLTTCKLLNDRGHENFRTWATKLRNSEGQLMDERKTYNSAG